MTQEQAATLISQLAALQRTHAIVRRRSVPRAVALSIAHTLIMAFPWFLLVWGVVGSIEAAARTCAVPMSILVAFGVLVEITRTGLTVIYMALARSIASNIALAVYETRGRRPPEVDAEFVSVLRTAANAIEEDLRGPSTDNVWSIVKAARSGNREPGDTLKP